MDAHKDITPYSSAVIAMRHGRVLAPIAFRVPAPYLNLGMGTEFDEDEVRTGLCSHSWTAIAHLWHLLKGHFATGEMGRRLLRVVDHVHETVARLQAIDGLCLADGTPTRLRLVCEPDTAIVNFRVVTGAAGDRTDARVVDHRTRAVTQAFSGSIGSDPRVRGLRTSSTIASGRRFGGPPANVNVAEEAATLRLCFQTPEQLSTAITIRSPRTGEVMTPFDDFADTLRLVMSGIAPPRVLSLEPVWSSDVVMSGDGWLPLSPLLRTSHYLR